MIDPATLGPADQVLSVRYAHRRVRRSEVFHEYDTYGVPDATLDMDYNFWVVRDDDGITLVDTGYDVPARDWLGEIAATPTPECLRLLDIAPESVTRVITSHFHYDHIGGVRAMAALGATILVEKGHEAALKKVLDAPHTHPPDDLARAGAKAGKMEVYEGKKVIKDGAQSLELIPFTGSPHVEPMVMAYVPGSRVLFQSDLWFPGTGAPANPAVAQLQDSIKKANLNVSTMVGGHGTIDSESSSNHELKCLAKRRTDRLHPPRSLCGD